MDKCPDVGIFDPEDRKLFLGVTDCDRVLFVQYLLTYFYTLMLLRGFLIRDLTRGAPIL